MAADNFSLKLLKNSVAQLCTVIGWTNAHVSALDVLTEITKRFILETGQHAHRYSEQFGRTQPTLDDFALAFEDMGVSISGLEEYAQNIQSVPPVNPVPSFPVATHSQLNFMKPGSREVLTRPVHIQEYLPPMNPSLEEEQLPESLDGELNLSSDVQALSPSRSNQLKRHGEPADSSMSKRLRLFDEEEQRLREISSVMMTTSGFISEAREGKLPEARLPLPFFDEEIVDVKPKKAPPMKRILEGVKKIEPVEPKKKVKQEPAMDLPPSPAHALPKKFRDKKTPKPEPISVSEDVGYTVKALSQPIPKTIREPKPIEPEKPLEKMSKLNLFKKFLKGKEDKKVEEIDVETVEPRREPFRPKTERSPSPPIRQRSPSPPPRSPTPPPPTPETLEKKKRKRKEKKFKEEIPDSHGYVVEENVSPPPRFEPRSYPFVPPFSVGGDLKQLPSALKNLPPGLLGIRPGGGVPTFPIRPVFPPPVPSHPAKERTPTPPPKAWSPRPSSVDNLLTSPISDTYMSDVQSPTGQESPRKSKKEKKKKEKKFKSKDKDERVKDKEEKLRLKEEKKQKKEEKRLLKKIKEEKEVEEIVEKPEKPKEKEKEREKEKDKEKEKEKEKEKPVDDSAPPKITFKFGSPPPPVERSPTPEPAPSLKVSVKPAKKEKEQPRALPEPKSEVPVVATPAKTKVQKKSPFKAKKEKPVKNSPPSVKAPTPKPPTPKPPTPKPPPAPKPTPAVPKLAPVTPKAAPVAPKVALVPPKVAPVIPKAVPVAPKVAPATPKVAPATPKVTPAAKKTQPVPVQAPAKTPEVKVKKAEKAAKTPKTKEVKFSPKAEKSPKEAAKKKPAEAPVIAESVGSYFDEEGNKIWICPTCGRQDDGTPMIGCDECDDWYHWVCVGIRVAPSESENWYCQRCLAKKKGMMPEKKKGKKKKGE